MFNKILVAIDLAHQEQVPCLVDAALEIRQQKQGEICLFYADPNVQQGVSTQQFDSSSIKRHQQEVRLEMASLLASLKQNCLPEGFDSIECQTAQGSVHEQILKQAKCIKADAIVLMSKRPGLSSYFIGSNADKVVRHAKCSVFVIRD
ncbi:hypothetical protein A9Q77_11470 [Marinomonas sp. 42_23_T18]|nr:hypothetical protein A9Q77_11470 [Marinomonas sp. 42_23_T18]